jgi:hypothetical protein
LVDSCLAMSTASTSLALRCVLGINGNVTDNLSFVENDTLVYVAGHNIIIYNRNDKKQRFIYGSERSDGVSAFAAGAGKR